jgi:amino acid transporter
MFLYIILGIVAVAALGYLVSLFLSKKSSQTQKLVALGALILSGLTILICGAVIIFGGHAEIKDPYAFPLDPKPLEPEGMSKTAEFLILLVIILILVGIIVFLYFREQKELASGKGKNKTKGKGF